MVRIDEIEETRDALFRAFVRTEDEGERKLIARANYFLGRLSHPKPIGL